MSERKKFAWLVGIFIVAYSLPLGSPEVSSAILEAFRLLQWYAIHHTLACVVPAMFIAGAISTFLSQASVMRYLGPTASKPVAYGASLLLVYALGHSVLILLAGTSMGIARKLIESKKITRATDLMRRAAGGVIILVGVFFGYTALK